MDTSLDLQFKNFNDKDQKMENLIKEKVSRLEKFNKHIVSCHVFIEQLKNTQHSHHSYYIRLDVTIPHHEIVVKREPNKGRIDEAYLAKIVREMFSTVERQLKQVAQKQRGEVKAHTRDKNVLIPQEEEEDEYAD